MEQDADLVKVDNKSDTDRQDVNISLLVGDAMYVVYDDILIKELKRLNAERILSERLTKRKINLVWF